MGVAAAWLGLIEGVSDGSSSFAKMGSGYYTDKLPRRKFVAVLGYVVTAFGTAAIGLATTAWQVLLARAAAWLGRGVRTPIRKALLAAAVTRETYGRPSASSECWTRSARLSVPLAHCGCWVPLITTTQACLLSRSCRVCSLSVSLYSLSRRSSAHPPCICPLAIVCGCCPLPIGNFLFQRDPAAHRVCGDECQPVPIHAPISWAEREAVCQTGISALRPRTKSVLSATKMQLFRSETLRRKGTP
jgi:hypothetical protein